MKHSRRCFLFGAIGIACVSCVLIIGIVGKGNLFRWRKYSHGNKLFIQKGAFDCLKDIPYEKEMRDQLWHYFEHSKHSGIPKTPKNRKDISRFVADGRLLELESNEYYVLDTMYYSYPYLIQDAHDLLSEIGERFQRKLENTGLECTRFTVTSVLRTEESIRRLQRRNRNSVRNSSHLHGTTFDVSYKTFFSIKPLSEGEVHYLGQMLMRTLWEIRREKKCWVTYEVWQTCLHVVSR